MKALTPGQQRRIDFLIGEMKRAEESAVGGVKLDREPFVELAALYRSLTLNGLALSVAERYCDHPSMAESVVEPVDVDWLRDCGMRLADDQHTVRTSVRPKRRVDMSVAVVIGVGIVLWGAAFITRDKHFDLANGTLPASDTGSENPGFNSLTSSLPVDPPLPTVQLLVPRAETTTSTDLHYTNRGFCFVKVFVFVQNDGVGDVHVNPNDFTLSDADGRTQSVSEDTYLLPTYLKPTTIGNHQSASGWLMFLMRKQKRYTLTRRGVGEPPKTLELKVK